MSQPSTILAALSERVEDCPAKYFLRFRNNDLTYAEFDRCVRTLANGLRHHQIGTASQGSNHPPIVPTLLPNCSDGIALWFAANRIGRVWAPINTEFRGAGLAHAINLTGSRDLIVEADLLPHAIEISDQLEHIGRLFVRGKNHRVPHVQPPEAWEVRRFEDLASVDDVASPTESTRPSDPSLLIYTSGTTGPSKACELSNYYVVGQAHMMSRALGLNEDDVLFCPYPIFHWDATIGTVIPALLCGATAVITERFSVSSFWADVRHFGVTVFDFMGATLTFLYKQDPDTADPDTAARLAWGVPMPAFKADFETRFGLTLVEGYGSTEGGAMVFQVPGAAYPDGSCGRAVPEFQVRIVDDKDRPLDAGEIGEIVARPTQDLDRNLMMTGYYHLPELTAETFRGGWLHTGDLGRLDERDNLFFEGRKSDSIRRRGENISAFEIEQVIGGHPAVLEVAAYGVPSEFTEEDVAVAVTLRKGSELGLHELLEFCASRMARHMVPSEVRFLDRLPKTPTEKVAKQLLKEWHREGA